MGKATIVDRVESYFGLRRIEARDGRFIINGIPVFLRLVLAQNYWPDSLLAAPDSDALRREVELAQSLGFNGIRIHQKIEDPRFLYWCDRLGMLVWSEAANAYVYSDRAAEMLTREWLEAVRRDYNHPSIITWVPLNESWGVPDLDRSAQQRHFVQALYHLTRALDPTRPVIGNDGWQHAVGDVFGVHDYAPTGDMLRERYADRATIARTFREVRPHHHPLLGEGVAHRRRTHRDQRVRRARLRSAGHGGLVRLRPVRRCRCACSPATKSLSMPSSPPPPLPGSATRS